MNTRHFLTLILFAGLLLSGCAPVAPDTDGLQVVAVESFLADITQQVAGDRLTVQTLIPAGLDPHSFEATPKDVALIADSQVLILNGGGLEEWLDEILQNAGGKQLVIEAAAGLESREPSASEAEHDEHEEDTEHPDHENDPHFWLDPLLVIHYVENIRDGLIEVDPDGKDAYTQNAAAYIQRLTDLDAWIVGQVQQIPAERRLLVTNHESFGYFADRYGFRIIGAIIPSVSSGAAPSAQQMAELVDHIRAEGAPAIFLETGASPQLAEQLAAETGVKVVTGLSTHSVQPVDGKTVGYIEMMKDNTEKIVLALK
ncbi:MAG: zinc ABC transporter substrate-binding protein [Anaerolineaceae bacterium]|nr:zinc ABC transporter substrate-binding protein [Anaerolineaceae bacterium]